MEFYRVYNDRSISRYENDIGFLAGDPDRLHDLNPRTRRERRNLKAILKKHLNWSSRDLTPLISMYKNPYTALATAKAWGNMGKRNVRIARINGIALQRDRDVSFRNLRKLAKKLKTWIDPEIWNSTADELVVLRQIPRKAITNIYTAAQLEQDLRSPFTKGPYKIAFFFCWPINRD